MVTNARRIGMIVLSTILRWPLWVALAVSRLVVPWRTLFVVYPGDETDIKAYSPDFLVWMRDTWLYRGKPQFAGVQIRRGRHAFFGIVVYLSNTIDELRNDRRLVLDIVKRLDFIAKMLGLQVVALAGQLPSVMRKHGLSLKAPFIDGRNGSAFSVVETVCQLFEKHDLDRNKSRLVAVGAGFLGEAVLEVLEAQGYRIEAVDIVKTRSGVHIGEEALGKLSHANVVIVMTPKGQDFIPYLEHVGTETIIIDDTHPRIRPRDIPQPVYKVALEWPGFEFLPRLPGYKKQWIPGCMVEAIVMTNSNEALTSYHRFRENARNIGIKVPLN